MTQKKSLVKCAIFAIFVIFVGAFEFTKFRLYERNPLWEKEKIIVCAMPEIGAAKMKEEQKEEEGEEVMPNQIVDLLAKARRGVNWAPPAYCAPRVVPEAKMFQFGFSQPSNPHPARE